MTTSTDISADREAVRRRIADGFALNATKIAQAEAALEKAREQRRDLLLLALEGAEKGENVYTYTELADLSGLSRSAVNKIVEQRRRELREAGA